MLSKKRCPEKILPPYPLHIRFPVRRIPYRRNPNMVFPMQPQFLEKVDIKRHHNTNTYHHPLHPTRRMPHQQSQKYEGSPIVHHISKDTKDCRRREEQRFKQYRPTNQLETDPNSYKIFQHTKLRRYVPIGTDF